MRESSEGARARTAAGGPYFALLIVAVTLFYLWPVVWWLGPRHWSAPVAIALMLGLSLEYHRRNSPSAPEWGFSWPDFLPGLRLSLLFTTPVMIGIAYVGWRQGSITGRQEPAQDLAGLFVWALAQQFALQTVLLRELRRKLPVPLAVPAAAGIFALLHTPNPFLVPVTFAGAVLWCWLYIRHPNLLPVALSHSLASLMILACLTRSLTGGMRVGYSYLLLP